MSPASSGSLEVEHYIGACLISSTNPRSKHSTTNGASNKPNRDVFYPRDVYNNGGFTYHPRNNDAWAGGMPLISFANHQRRNNRNATIDSGTRCSSPRVVDDPISRLAVHTQGLPLILSGRHGNRRTKGTRNCLPQGRGVPDSAKKNSECKDNGVNGVDTLSVASDESSGSNHSETSLPRIIKPRKRRKKDRKPHPGRNTQNLDNIPDTRNHINKTYIPFYCEQQQQQQQQSQHHHQQQQQQQQQTQLQQQRRVHPLIISDNRYLVTNNSVKSSDSLNDLSSETPKLHHRFEDVVGGEDNDELSLCQCRYCDPAGQIWDVDRHCYSPFLTTPSYQKQLSTDSSSSSSSTSSTDFSVTSKKQHLSERISSALQSQCLISTFSLSDEDVTSGKTPELTTKNQQQKCLEISTKIVTSPNGHRDLEIRLFSSSSSSSLSSSSSSSLSSIDNHGLITNRIYDNSKVTSLRLKSSDKLINKMCLKNDECELNFSPEE